MITVIVLIIWYLFMGIDKIYPTVRKNWKNPGGCEDPRVTMTEDGLYVMAYTSWNRKVARLCIATSHDLVKWENMALLC